MSLHRVTQRKGKAVIATVRSFAPSGTTQRSRNTPAVLQTLASIDSNARSVSLNVELATRYGRSLAFDWLLRLDLGSRPPLHEQWHGQTHCINGQLDLVVQPQHWPDADERWFLRLWLRDPSGNADWDLIETRSLL